MSALDHRTGCPSLGALMPARCTCGGTERRAAIEARVASVNGAPALPPTGRPLTEAERIEFDRVARAHAEETKQTNFRGLHRQSRCAYARRIVTAACARLRRNMVPNDVAADLLEAAAQELRRLR